MSLFADVERLLERVFERTSARIFRTRLQAVQLERRVERAMELGRTVENGQPVVPDAIRVRITPADLRSAAGETGGAEALATRLADAALAFARRNRYHLNRRPTVHLVADPSLADGQVEIEVSAGARAPRPGIPGLPSPTPPQAAPAPSAVPPTAQAEPTSDIQPAVVALPPSTAASTLAPEEQPPVRSGEPAVAAGAAPAPWVTATGSIRGDGDPTRTMVYRHPAPAPPRAILREVRRDGAERTIEVGAGILELGRAKDCEIVLDDPRASRRHGRLQARRGALVYTDLGSTNGSRVNGIRVDEIALGFGDRLQIGDTVLVVENLPG